MNEVLVYRLVKKVTVYGIPKELAKEIVETAVEASKGRNVEKYIEYALVLTYGVNFISRIEKSKMDA